MAQKEVVTSETESSPIILPNQVDGKAYYASIHPGPDIDVPEEFATQILQLEALLGMPVWLIIQNSEGPWGEIGSNLYKGFQDSLSSIPQGQPVAVLIESPGGDAHFAYRLARMLQRHTGNKVTIVVPQYAKSAATLLALGAADLIPGRDAELGPLDVQMLDLEREAIGSALDAVQSLERLNAFAMTALDQTMLLMIKRTGKRTDLLLPHVFTYVANFLKPLLDKIDTLDYTKKSRELKVAEEYAIRLMRPNYTWTIAKRIARQLVEKYPTHGFVIDSEEASNQISVAPQETFGLGLKTKRHSQMAAIQSIIDEMYPFLDSLTVVGRILVKQ